MANWRDIQDRAVTFAHNYKDAKDEAKDAKPFWLELFALYGVSARSEGSFEESVKIHGNSGVAKMDYFSPKRFLIEQKSRGKSLTEAYLQAMDYFTALSEDVKPRYIIVCDFEHMHVYDLEAPEKKRKTEFLMKDFPKNVKKLSFLLNEEVQEDKVEKPIDVRAVETVGKLHKALKESNYPKEHLAPLLTRLVFCFFSDDTGIFEQNALRNYLQHNTKDDGSDIGYHLDAIFQVLDTPNGAGGNNNTQNKRQSTIPDALLALPYVNGGLFKDPLPAVFGSREVRDMLIKCFAFDWSDVSPAIFGSMFQSVMDEKERHDLGAHYTSEKNILKVIGPLFLDELHSRLEKAKTKEQLHALWDTISKITLLDPACGCGNFLVVAYRELREIEIEIIKRLDSNKKGVVAQVEKGQGHLGMEVDLSDISKMSVERMYGIEIEPFAAEVARLSLWLIDEIMHMKLGAYYGKPLRKLPLVEAPHIVKGNALTLDWNEVVPKGTLTHILGNPPFLGSKVMDNDQREEIKTIFKNARGSGVLDYVTGWYKKAAEYIQGTNISCAFVSTNSITQGEQPAILWRALWERGVSITFAHRTFKWSNEARGKAAVYCVIIGFALRKPVEPRLFVYEDIRGEPHEVPAKNINPYLVDAPNIVVESRSKPLCDVPEIGIGNKPIDGGLYLFTPEEKHAFVQREPGAGKFFRPWIGSEEFINGSERWCLWVGDADPAELKKLPEVMKRIDAVKQYRLLSKSAPTRKLAETPTRFHVENIPTESYIVIPEVSSEVRKYIPMGFENPEVLSSNLVKVLRGGTLYHFGVLESEMHMAWVRAVCGRLGNGYRYSKDIVYNNFPWPTPTEEQKKKVEECAQAVLGARAAHTGATLADLYDPLTMPKDLLDAHKALDKAVDACYGTKKFTSEPDRLEFLFERYKELVGGGN